MQDCGGDEPWFLRLIVDLSPSLLCRSFFQMPSETLFVHAERRGGKQIRLLFAFFGGLTFAIFFSFFVFLNFYIFIFFCIFFVFVFPQGIPPTHRVRLPITWGYGDSHSAGEVNNCRGADARPRGSRHPWPAAGQGLGRGASPRRPGGARPPRSALGVGERLLFRFPTQIEKEHPPPCLPDLFPLPLCAFLPPPRCLSG